MRWFHLLAVWIVALCFAGCLADQTDDGNSLSGPGGSEDACGSHGDLRSCMEDVAGSCGWCADLGGQCMRGDEYGAFDTLCLNWQTRVNPRFRVLGHTDTAGRSRSFGMPYSPGHGPIAYEVDARAGDILSAEVGGGITSPQLSLIGVGIGGASLASGWGAFAAVTIRETGLYYLVLDTSDHQEVAFWVTLSREETARERAEREAYERSGPCVGRADGETCCFVSGLRVLTHGEIGEGAESAVCSCLNERAAIVLACGGLRCGTRYDPRTGPFNCFYTDGAEF